VFTFRLIVEKILVANSKIELGNSSTENGIMLSFTKNNSEHLLEEVALIF